MPRISVLMSVYNGEKYLREAVDSVLNQTFADFEFIIINDGSTDKTKEILESYQDDRIRLYKNQNKGLTRCLNEAIGYSRGEYIARMDADDISSSERFERQVRFLDSNQDIMMCGTWASFIDENGKCIREYKRPVGNREIKKEFIFHNPFIHSSVMIRKSVFEKVGFYDESFRYAQDYELWTRISRFKLHNIPEFLLKYRVSEKQMTKMSHAGMKREGIMIRFLYILRFIFRF